MFNQLETPESSHWHNPLLNDISFIKKHLRYPVNKKTIWPMLSIAGIAIWMIVIYSMIVLLSYGKFQSEGLTNNSIGGVLVVSMMLVTTSILLYKRMQQFKFIRIKSKFTAHDNSTLIRAFLAKQNIAFYQRTDAPEVFQIASMILDRTNGQREIMVFIADDNSILINSHFTVPIENKSLKSYCTGAHKKMAIDLKHWLKDNEQNFTHQFKAYKIEN